MNLPRWISESIRARRSSPEMRLSVFNLTRQTELAQSVGVADHGAQRRKGLLGRKRIAAGEGLWIVPCESVHTFGMQFAIDLIYLDRDRRVRKIREEVVPWRVSACLTAHSVLELASGSIRRAQTEPGDKLEFCCSSPLLRDEPAANDNNR
jgi:uncharacterized membrane protein (UPF0127 family)